MKKDTNSQLSDKNGVDYDGVRVIYMDSNERNHTKETLEMSEPIVVEALELSVDSISNASKVADTVMVMALSTVFAVGIYTITKKGVETLYAARKFRKSNKK